MCAVEYRVTNVGPYPKSGHIRIPMRSKMRRDAGLVRLHAAEWHIDPHK